MSVTGAPILAVRGATMRFGGFTALSNVTAEFPEGQLTAIIGPNGAGKSTLFNILSGAFPPTEGEVLFRGRNIAGRRQHHFARIGISKSFQITNIFPDLTALENVRIAVQAMTMRFDLWTPRSRLVAMEERAAELLREIFTTPMGLLFLLIGTALGIVVGGGFEHLLGPWHTTLIEGVFDGLAAGTFLYIAALDVIHQEFFHRRATWLDMALFSAAMAVMLLLSLAA